jgi:hypothetical protein
MRRTQIALLNVTLAFVTVGCPTISLSVDEAKFTRAVGQAQPTDKDVFLEVLVTLKNISEKRPILASDAHYMLTSTSGLGYLVGIPSFFLSPPCGYLVAAGSEFSCRIGFELPKTEMPLQVDYIDRMRNLKATAPITVPIAPPSCLAPGLRCLAGGDCCTGVCDPFDPYTNICSLLSGTCTAAGMACTSSLQCCTGNCYGGYCSKYICVPSGLPWTGEMNCCTWHNDGSRCLPVSATCGTMGEICSTNGDCCSGICAGDRCSKNAGDCSVNGDLCFHASECCSGFCNQPDNVGGTCATP